MLEFIYSNLQSPLKNISPRTKVFWRKQLNAVPTSWIPVPKGGKKNLPTWAPGVRAQKPYLPHLTVQWILWGEGLVCGIYECFSSEFYLVNFNCFINKNIYGPFKNEKNPMGVILKKWMSLFHFSLVIKKHCAGAKFCSLIHSPESQVQRTPERRPKLLESSYLGWWKTSPRCWGGNTPAGRWCPQVGPPGYSITNDSCKWPNTERAYNNFWSQQGS